MSHASNVCGTVLPIAEVGRRCRKQDLRLIVDAAQTAGKLNIDVAAASIDALAFPGHKGLLGSQGIGGFVISEDFAQLVTASIWGGTGSLSHGLEQPDFLPDKFESGTMNIPGILGLKAAIEYLQSTGTYAIHQQEMKLYQHFIAGAPKIKGLKLIAAQSAESLNNSFDKVAVASVDFPNYDNAEIATRLDRDFSIMARCGLHCSPTAHKTLGTYPQGSLRFSFGHKNSIEEVDYLLDSLQHILNTVSSQ
jgi:selenocysteine lyase/cysteine desulfurase